MRGMTQTAQLDSIDEKGAAARLEEELNDFNASRIVSEKSR